MWKKLGGWTLGVASSVMLMVPAFSARANETQNMQDQAAQAGQQMKNAGQSAGNAAQGAWNSSKSAASSAGNTAEQAGSQAAGAVKNQPAPVSDEWITSQLKDKLSNAGGTADNVEVHTKKDVVTLSGTVADEASRRQAVDLARQVSGVKEVKDHIKVNPNR